MNILTGVIREVFIRLNFVSKLLLRWLVYTLALLVAIFQSPIHAQLAFEEVTVQSGIDFTGRSYGLSWGDFDADGWADIWTGNHRTLASIYRNNRDGTFTNIIPILWANPSTPDGHGAGWGDFDNDGDQDIVQLVGAGSGVSSGPNLFLVFNNDIFIDEAAGRGLDFPLGRGRTPLWLDWNNDGMLDIYVSNLIRPDGRAPSVYFQQNNGLFLIPEAGDLTSNTNNLFAQSSDLLGDGRNMLIVHNQNNYPSRIFEFGADPVIDLRAQLNIPNSTSVRDVAIEDFNGDLLPDFYLARLNPSASDSVLIDANTLKSHFNVNSNERGIKFKCNCDLTFQTGPSWVLKENNIFIGSAGAHPSSTQFTVSASNPAAHGIVAHSPGVSFGLYIGYTPATQTWTVLASKGSRLALNVLISSSGIISDLQHINLNPGALALADRLLLNTGSGFVVSSGNPGLAMETACQSVTTGDYDNDMDVDIYLVCRGQVNNWPNILLENNGNGVFQAVPFAAGADGSLEGRGDSAGTADFNNDGFLDLFITNGDGEVPFTNGPYQLFRNTGNGNHWIELQLQGVISNRDGIGASVILSSGGKSQLREQNGRMHRIAQDHQRLHFGLANNSVVDEITIYWPSGIVQNLVDIQSDQILTVIENADTPDDCGAPSYNPAADRAVFVWKDCDTGRWHTRMTAAGGFTTYQGNVTASQSLSNVTGFSIERGDMLDYTSNPAVIDFRLKVSPPYQDGFDFNTSAGSATCFDINLPTNSMVFYGRTRTQVSVPFELETLISCGSPGQPQLSINHISVSEGDGEAVFTISLNPASTNTVSVDYTTLDGTAVDGSDYTASSGGLSFNPGQSSNNIIVPILDDVVLENDEFFTVDLSNAINATIADGNGVATIHDDELSACGEPIINPAVDNALFLWRDCVTDEWHVRVAAANGFLSYNGQVSSDLPFNSVSGVSLENADILDNSTDPTVITYRMRLSPPNMDGFDFSYPNNANVCFNLGWPKTVQVLVGASRFPLEVPFDLNSLGRCP